MTSLQTDEEYKIDPSLRAEALAELSETHLHEPTTPTAEGHRAGQVPLPAFLALGGGAHEVPTAGTQMEPGSIREITCRATAGTAMLTLLCVCLGIACAASPWFSVTVGNCVFLYSPAAYGVRSVADCGGGSTFRVFPAPYSSLPEGMRQKIKDAVGTLGFAEFLLAIAILGSLLSLAVSGLMSFRLARGLPPHKYGNAFLLTAFTATAFTFSALAMIVGSARLLQALNQSYADTTYTPTLAPGHGAGDAMVVFLCAALSVAVVVKIRVRAEAVRKEGGPERAELADLLGTDPEGHFCL